MIGDVEPEDAWHPDDTPAELARNLARRITLVDGRPEPRSANVRILLAVIAHRVNRAAARRHDLSERDLLRLEQLAADLEHVRQQVDA